MLPAQAAPKEPPTVHTESVSHPKPNHTDDRKLSKGEQAQIALAVRIIHNSVSKKTRSLDYRRADKYDQGNTKERRRTVAGWMLAGGRVDHITKGEKAKVKAMIPKGDPYADIRSPNGMSCTGKSGVVKYKKYLDFRINLDSCETARVIFVGTVVAIAVGTILAAVFATNPATAALSVLTVVVGAVIGIGVAYLSYLADTSKYNAVYVRDKYHAIWAKRQ